MRSTFDDLDSSFLLIRSKDSPDRRNYSECVNGDNVSSNKDSNWRTPLSTFCFILAGMRFGLGNVYATEYWHDDILIYDLRAVGRR